MDHFEASRGNREPSNFRRTADPDVQQALADLGAEPLEGSGFETELPDPDFD
jgi:hypothetical protein